MGRVRYELLGHKSVHFIIPAYMASGTIFSCINSINNQNYPNDSIRISVVENGPKDLDPEEINNIKNCSYYYNKITGRSAARNYLLSDTHEDYIAYIDADVVLSENWLKEVMLSIQSPYSAVCTGPVERSGNSLLDKFRIYLSEKTTNHRLNTLENTKSLGCINTAAVLFKTSVLQDLGGFDTHFVRAEDYELTQRIFKSGHVVCTTEKAHAKVFWDRGYFEYLVTRPFQSGLYTAIANKKHNIFRSFNFFQKSPVLLTVSLMFELGYFIGSKKKYTQASTGRSTEIIKKASVDFYNSSGRLLTITNDHYFLLINDVIYLYNPSNLKFYQFQSNYNKTFLALIRSGRFKSSSPEDDLFLDSLVDRKILK